MLEILGISLEFDDPHIVIQLVKLKNFCDPVKNPNKWGSLKKDFKNPIKQVIL